MTVRQLNTDIRKLHKKAAYFFIYITPAPDHKIKGWKKEELKREIEDEWRRLHGADPEMKDMTKKSMIIMLKVNNSFKIKPQNLIIGQIKHV